MWTDKDDQELHYGIWNVSTAKTTHFELYKVDPSIGEGEIWPDWSEGVPKELRRKVTSDYFYLKDVLHNRVTYHSSIKLKWDNCYTVSQLKSDYSLLPTYYENEWSGVYRIFSPNTTIGRCSGEDPTGTWYLGQAGGSGRGGCFRDRIIQIIRKDHHATRYWYSSSSMRQRYPWDSFSIEWAYTDLKRKRSRFEKDQEPFPEAILAERWLLRCYKDSFGELPPWNEKM